MAAMASSPPNVRGAGLVGAIVSELKQLIYSGEYKPGERINEASLALRMGTSRGPIREAVKVLAGQGLVTAVPNRGVIVRQMSLRDMIEVYELRAYLFSYGAVRACDHLTDSSAKKLEKLLAAMYKACEADKGTAYYEINLQFHATIMDVAHNRRASQLYDDYVKELHLFRRKYFNVPGNMRRSNMEHRAIFNAIVASNHAAARRLAEQHVLDGRTRLLSSADGMSLSDIAGS